MADNYYSGLALFNSPVDTVGNRYSLLSGGQFFGDTNAPYPHTDTPTPYSVVLAASPVVFTPAGTVIKIVFLNWAWEDKFVAAAHAYGATGVDPQGAIAYRGSWDYTGIDHPPAPSFPASWERQQWDGGAWQTYTKYLGRRVYKVVGEDHAAVWITGVAHDYTSWASDLTVADSTLAGSQANHTTGAAIGIDDVSMTTAATVLRLRQSDAEPSFGGSLDPDKTTMQKWVTPSLLFKESVRQPHVVFSSRGSLAASASQYEHILAKRLDSGDSAFVTGVPRPAISANPFAGPTGVIDHRGFWVGSSRTWPITPATWRDGNYYWGSSGTFSVAEGPGARMFCLWRSGQYTAGVYPREFKILRHYSDDDGLSAWNADPDEDYFPFWSDPFDPTRTITVFTAGRFPIVRFDNSAGGGTTLYAAMVGSSPCKIHGAIEASGDTVPGTEYVFKDETATDITVDDDPFDICKGSAGTWWLTALKGGVVKYWTSDDMKTWKLSAL